MAYCKKIDKSLTERQSIVNLLESLKREDITLEEMERIGVKLQKAGARALSPLIRRLWHEKNGDHISRYVYLLDFFEDQIWIDQIIRIALKRSDLEEGGKAALLSVLEDYGVDITVPPFSRVLEGISGPIEVTLPKLLDKGEEGVIRFMEDFLQYPDDTQTALVRCLPNVKDPRVLSLLEILLRYDIRDVVVEALATLGKIREGKAALILHAFNAGGDAQLGEVASRSLRRLSFLGINPDPVPEPVSCTPSRTSSVGSSDGSGNRTLWFSMEQEGHLDVLIMQLHETKGMLDALGYSDLSYDRYEKLRREVTDEEGLVEIDPTYALLLIRDALYLNKMQGSLLPAEFYVRRGMLCEEVPPKCYTPDFTGYELETLALSREHLEQSATLFEEEYFDGWFTVDTRLLDLAEEHDLLEKTPTGRNLARAVEKYITKFVELKVTDDPQRMARRLFLIADLMVRSGRERAMVEKTLAVAVNLLHPRYPHQRNPFFRQFALESLKITREAVAEGFDPRLHREWDEDDELWD